MKRRIDDGRLGTKNAKHFKYPHPILSGPPLWITSFDSINHLKLVAPVQIEHPKTRLIKAIPESYRMLGKLKPYTDSDGKSFPLDSWMEIVPAMNRYLKTCEKGRMIETTYSDDTQQSVSPPSGVHMFAVPLEITPDLIRDALCDANNLYWNPKHRANRRIHMMKLAPSPACNFLFYLGCGKGNHTIRGIFQILFTEAPSLARYALIYLGLIKDILCLDDDEVESINMTLNHYDPMGAINSHVDTVYIFQGTLGPIFTVAMGPSEKMLDLLPVFLPDTYRPTRLFSRPNELMLMDGEARTLWAHSKPKNYPHEQFSIVFKCPEFRKKTHVVPFEYEGASLGIPYHYVSSSTRTSSLEV